MLSLVEAFIGFFSRIDIKARPRHPYMEKQALLPIPHFEDEESGRFSLYQFAFCVFNGVTGAFRLRRSWPAPCLAKD